LSVLLGAFLLFLDFFVFLFFGESVFEVPFVLPKILGPETFGARAVFVFFPLPPSFRPEHTPMIGEPRWGLLTFFPGHLTSPQDGVFCRGVHLDSFEDR